MNLHEETLSLVEPGFELERAYLEMIAECRAAGEHYSYHELARLDFRSFIEKLSSFKRGVGLPEGYVPMATFWLTRDREIILGEARLRSHLTPTLEVEGGHIGYMIRPAQRRQGYGTKILEMVLEKARREGHAQVLVTCDTENIGSARVIEKNGGRLEGYSLSAQSKKQVSRYWIELGK